MLKMFNQPKSDDQDEKIDMYILLFQILSFKKCPFLNVLEVIWLRNNLGKI